MKMYTRIALIMAIGLVSKCSAHLDAISEDRKNALRDGNRIYQEQESHRDTNRIHGQRLLFGFLDELVGQVIDFDSSDCPMGECLSQKQCGIMNGNEVPDVSCASGFGVCCRTSSTTTSTPAPPSPPPAAYDGGNVDITGNGGNFFTPTDVDGRKRTFFGRDRIFKATLSPADDVVQVKINITLLDITGPTDGDCGNDTLVFHGANPGLEIPVLCGKITNQTLYIDIDNSKGMDHGHGYEMERSLELTIARDVDGDRSWNISIVFLKKGDVRRAPRRCLQYFTHTEGTLQSFNYEGTPPMMLNNLNYNICFGYVANYCDIALNMERFDFGNRDGVCTDDYVGINYGKYCGDFEEGTITANASGPISFGVVVSDDSNEDQEEGFSGSYSMMGCANYPSG